MTRIVLMPLFILSFACMFIFGFVENLRGVSNPEIQGEFSVTFGSMGLLMLFSSLGYLSMTFLGGFIADRIGQKKLMILGFLILVFGCTSIVFADTFFWTVVILFIINAGFGCFEVATNSLAAQIFVRNTAVMMNMMHLFYGLASIIAPMYGGWILVGGNSWKYIYFFALIPIVAVLIYLLFIKFPKESGDHETTEKKLSLKEIALSKKVWLFIGICGLGQVAELGAGNWTVIFLQDARGMDKIESATYMTLFFVGFTVGRIFGGFVSERFGYARSIAWFTISYLVFFTAGMLLDNTYAFFFALTGISVSIMFPTVMAMIMKEFTVGRSSIMGFIITMSGIVNMLANWVIGKTNDIFSVTVGYGTLAIYTGLILVCIAMLKPLLIHRKGDAAKSRS